MLPKYLRNKNTLGKVVLIQNKWPQEKKAISNLVEAVVLHFLFFLIMLCAYVYIYISLVKYSLTFTIYKWGGGKNPFP